MVNNAFDFDALLKQVPIGDIASKFGVDQATAHDAVTKALPGILGGLATNAQNPSGAESLEAALTEHNRGIRGLADVDEEDGEKIISHALGGKRKDVVSAVSGGSDDLVSKVLPLLAPIVMAFLAKNMSAKKQNNESGGISDILGSILGGNNGGFGGLGSILGGASKSGGLGGIFSSILGR